MVRTVPIAAAAKHIHPIVQHRCRVEVAIARRQTAGRHKCPFHCLQIQAVHIARELIDFLLEAAEYVHGIANNARRMAIPNARYRTGHLGFRPRMRVRIEAEQNVTADVIVAAAPHVHIVLVRDRRMAVTLKWHFRIAKQIAGFVAARRHQRPAQRLRVQHMHVDRFDGVIVFVAAITAERVDLITDHAGRMIDASRTAFDAGNPLHGWLVVRLVAWIGLASRNEGCGGSEPTVVVVLIVCVPDACDISSQHMT